MRPFCALLCAAVLAAGCSHTDRQLWIESDASTSWSVVAAGDTLSGTGLDRIGVPADLACARGWITSPAGWLRLRIVDERDGLGVGSAHDVLAEAASDSLRDTVEVCVR